MRFVIWFTGGERPQAERCKQFFFDLRDNLSRLVAFEQLKRQSTHGEDLIGTKGGIRFTGAMVHVNHVVEAASFLVPEFAAEGFQTTVESFLPLRRELAGDAKRVKPERLNFHRLSSARCDNPFANLRV